MKSEELNIAFIELKDAAFRYAVSLLHDHTEAEDAVQDLYERLWRRRLLIRSGGFRALVMTSIRNICLDLIRRRERLRQQTTATPADLIEDSRNDEDLMPAINHIMASLPEREREVMHLRDIEQMEFEEIAAIIGTSESAARMALSRARQKVKNELIKIMHHGL